MLQKILPLALLPILLFSQPAEARRLFWWQMVNPDGTAVSPDVYNGAYAPQDYPPNEEQVYGPDPYASQQEQFNAEQYLRYRREMQRRYGYQQGYADPAPYPSYAPPVAPLKFKKKHTKVLAAKPKLPAPHSAIVSSQVNAPAATVASTTSAKPPKAAATANVTCDKGITIVSSFGFTDVTAKSCEGTTFVYSAERGGKPFEINLSQTSGELTAVKRL